MKLKTLTLITLLVLLMSACNLTNPLVNDPLNGTSWELVAISKHRPIEGSVITISFENGQVSGSGGCNHYGGGYKLNGNKITFDALYMTEMACMSPAGVMEQELLYAEYLGKAQRFEIVDGQLQVYWSEHEALTFVPALNP